MCKWCTTSNYRKIYETHIGSIPVDDHGRSFHIHHIDGDHNNNNLDNLLCISVEDHYQLHLSQGDWWAAARLAALLHLDAEQLRALSSKSIQKRIADGTHPWLGDKNPSRQKIQLGTHIFLDSEFKRQNSLARVADGTHNFLGDRNPVHAKVADGTHHLLGGEIQRRTNQLRIANGTHNFLSSEFQSQTAHKRIQAGTHNFVTNHPNKRQATCPHCGKSGGGAGMKRWHFDRCKSRLT